MKDDVSEAADIVQVEERKEGRVEVMVYRKYAAFSGCFITIVILLSAVLMQASRNGNDLWLSCSIDKIGRGSTSFYLENYFAASRWKKANGNAPFQLESVRKSRKILLESFVAKLSILLGC